MVNRSSGIGSGDGCRLGEFGRCTFTAVAPASDSLKGMNTLEVTAWSPRHGLYDLLDQVFAPRDESDKSGDETSKKRAAPDDDHDTHASPKTQNTLILFEEVDVLRGEDRGFMAALATLIRTTKRPIALTSNATSLPGLAGSGAETVAGVGAEGLPLARVRFKAPSAADASAYASLVASAEGVAVPPAAVAAAAAPDESGNGKRAGGDVRRALHAAHFLSFAPIRGGASPGAQAQGGVGANRPALCPPGRPGG